MPGDSVYNGRDFEYAAYSCMEEECSANGYIAQWSQRVALGCMQWSRFHFQTLNTISKYGGKNAFLSLAGKANHDMEQMIIVCQILYGIGLSLVKTSMMALYLKLFGTKASIRTAIYVTGAIVWAWGLSIVLESFLICQPIEFNWNPTLPGGKCGNRNAAFVVAGVLNMVTDLMVMSLPIPYIWNLQLRVGRKIGLSVAFSLGLLYV